MIRLVIGLLFLILAATVAAAQSGGAESNAGSGAAQSGEAAPEAGDDDGAMAESDVGEDVWAAVDVLEEIAADEKKRAGYCAIAKELAAADAAGDDEKMEIAETKMTDFLTGLGEGYEDVWALGEEMEAGTEAVGVLEEAFAELEDQCAE